ncbi:TetR/AcrR family transcriptional regulator [Paenibacillus sp. sptzw28]|uniref:TetR/AcrR family transcriptional regulator n=1 Tax=Paenibacillus sp. sptzw28 TaxID=715179 RepID=UPI001C6E014A|nr:TetR/AcrR family transcriptional regulator [Paenibacillus sp. sptzw28]QYR20551.1 TetR/AcrR family transcriptional regulator [Paenibacillus sp. sptzw28]
MTTRRKQLTEEMKAGIRSAAAALFADKGFAAVTMREIAKAAGCSHTAIYLYFKNKEDLLQQIAIPPLKEMEAAMLGRMADPSASQIDRLLAVCREFAVFCLTKGSFYHVLITPGAVRIDEKEPVLEVNQIRNRLFGHLNDALSDAVGDGAARVDPAKALNHGRMLFYYMQGYVNTYIGSEEPTAALLERTLPIYYDGIRIFVAGIQQSIR